MKVKVLKVLKTYCIVEECINNLRGGVIHKRGFSLYFSYKFDKFIYIDDLTEYIKEGDILEVEVLFRRRKKGLTSNTRYVYKPNSPNIDEIFILWHKEQKRKYLKKLEEEQYRSFIDGIGI